MQLCFIVSGAQRILADPTRQSKKFLYVFMVAEPLPRMATDGSMLWKGFFVCGLLAATAFIIVNRHMEGGWLRRGLSFGLVHWLLMAPWFEFYLPYNVMHEPLPLVLLEGALWLCTVVPLGLCMSAVMNAGNSIVKAPHAP